MSIIEESDTIEAANLTWSVTDGITTTRRFIVKDIEGDPSAILYNCLDTDQLPKPGDKHPDIIGDYVDTVDVNPLDSTTCEVIVNYKPFITTDEEEAFQTKRISATVQSVETDLFYNDKNEQEQMETKYTYEDAESKPASVKQNPDVQVGRVNKEVPSIVISIDIIEEENPFKKILEFQGKINSAPWADGAAGTWLLSNVDTQTNDGGETWQSQYQFQYNPETWSVNVSYVNPETNKPPKDIRKNKTDGKIQGLKNYRIYERIDFRKLGLGG